MVKKGRSERSSPFKIQLALTLRQQGERSFRGPPPMRNTEHILGPSHNMSSCQFAILGSFEKEKDANYDNIDHGRLPALSKQEKRMKDQGPTRQKY
ncbi:hypothetical protein BDW66DRAFT_64313 [Aspergillus desertorum]